MLGRARGADRCVAIGEAGFDLHYEHSPRDEQEAAFRRQIRLATEVGRPLVIHSRDAWDDTFRVLDDEGVPERTIFHCFTGGPDEARARARPRLLPVVQRDRVVQDRRRRCATRPRSRPPTGCWSRPTARTSRPSRTAASRTSPRSCRSSARRWRGARGVDVERDRRRSTRANAARVVRRRAVTPSADPGAARRSTACGRARRSARTSSPTRTWPRTSCGSRACSPAIGSSRSGPGSGRSRSRLRDAGAHVRAVELDRHGSPTCSRTVVAGTRRRDRAGRRAHGRLARAARRRRALDHGRRTFRTTSRRRSSSRALETRADDRPLPRDGAARGRGAAGGACPATKAYGAVSVKVAYYARREGGRRRAARRCSCRKPKVDSALVRLERRARRR